MSCGAVVVPDSCPRRSWPSARIGWLPPRCSSRTPLPVPKSCPVAGKLVRGSRIPPTRHRLSPCSTGGSGGSGTGIWTAVPLRHSVPKALRVQRLVGADPCHVRPCPRRGHDLQNRRLGSAESHQTQLSQWLMDRSLVAPFRGLIYWNVSSNRSGRGPVALARGLLKLAEAQWRLRRLRRRKRDRRGAGDNALGSRGPSHFELKPRLSRPAASDRLNETQGVLDAVDLWRWDGRTHTSQLREGRCPHVARCVANSGWDRPTFMLIWPSPIRGCASTWSRSRRTQARLECSTPDFAPLPGPH